LGKGDFDADTDKDLFDFQWLQVCSDPAFVFLPSGCDAYDIDENGQISQAERIQFLTGFDGPVLPEAAGGP
jgi:hypothetical protein